MRVQLLLLVVMFARCSLHLDQEEIVRTDMFAKTELCGREVGSMLHFEVSLRVKSK